MDFGLIQEGETATREFVIQNNTKHKLRGGCAYTISPNVELKSDPWQVKVKPVSTCTWTISGLIPKGQEI